MIIPFPDKKYNIIYADPPYAMQTTSQVTNPDGSRIRPYNSMRFCDILELPINDISEDNCCLFLWAIAPLFPEALHLLRVWGFDFKTIVFTWVKRNKKSDSWFWGMGGWTRSNPEYCLLGTRGYPKRVAKDVHSIIDSRLEEHSKKPAEVRDKIVKLVGDLPRIELFARQKTEGWDVWGNEV